MNLLQINHVTVTQTGQTLAQLGVSINSAIQRIAFFPEGVVRHELGNTVDLTNSAPLPSAGLSEPITAATAGQLQFAANGIRLTIRQYG